MKFMQEEAIDVAILSDPYRICDNGCDSLADTVLGRAAILVPGKQVTVCNVIRDAEFVSARVGGYQIYSCYATPNPATRDMFGSLLRRLENSVRTVMHDTPVVVAGDFNARSAAWGDRVTTSRGDELCDLLGSLQLIVLNEGSTPTFNRGEGSIIDVTAVSERVRCLTWSVLGDTFNNSDHNYIRFDLDSGTGIRRQNLCSSARGWDVTKGIDPELLEVGLLIAEWLSPVEDLNRRDAAHIADFFDCHVKTACDIVLRRKSAPNMARKPVHWWNPELSVLRSNCVSARRCKTRLAARHKRLQQRLGVTNPTVVQAVLDVDATDAQLRMCKKALKTAVARSKKACWDELVQSVESDPFGKPYKLVMRKLSGPPATDRMELDTLRSTIETLFPAGHPNIHGAVLPLEPARRVAVPRTGNEVTPRAIILNVWARRLVECEDGVWTKRLIPNVVPWCNRRHGQLEFHMTQIMSGHGCFGVYLHKIGKETTKRCHHCGSPEDDAAHTLFVCPAWELDRLMMTNALDVRLHADNFSEVVLSNPAHWEAVATFCRKELRAQSSIISDLLSKLDHLKLISTLTKSPQVKDAIAATIESAAGLDGSRKAVIGAFNEVERVSRQAPAVHPSINPASQKEILSICQEIKSSIAKQQEDISSLLTSCPLPAPTYAKALTAVTNNQPPRQKASNHSAPAPRETQPEGWTRAERKKRKKSEKPEPPQKKTNGSSNNRTKRPPPDAIAIKLNPGETFAEILKAVRKDVDVERTGARITSIAESRNGEVLVRVTRGEERRANLESAIKEALGARATVRGLIKYDDIDITGLDGVTTENEVSNALMKAAGLTPNDASIRIKSVRPAPNGTKRATASMRSSDAVKVLEEGHIQIGLVWAKIRLRPITKRCFKCLGYGHSRFKCTGPDRSEACSLCTSAGHKAAECKNPPKCASCEDMKAPIDHYPGSSKCTSFKNALTRREQDSHGPAATNHLNG
ncbi:hypothetical protein AGLY_012252 [Aphis glycines]|uniref:CCHC-type domain-containing protein n=1 Tax=Aphis glycines TaxID=307491 RepID=A0A6G0T9I8_APHGL|nr:hypothetical protein AGLY_012252 [Aphis glycines]